MYYVYDDVFVHHIFVCNLLRQRDAASFQRFAEVGRHYFDKLFHRLFPVLDRSIGMRCCWLCTGSAYQVFAQNSYCLPHLMFSDMRPFLFILFFFEISSFVEDIFHTSRHTSREVSSCFVEVDCQTARHVFQTVITHTFHHHFYPSITHAEALSRWFRGCMHPRVSTVECDITDDNVFFPV